MTPFLVAATIATTMTHSPSAVHIAKKAHESIVLINILTKEGVMSGSGVYVGNSTVITNAHVVEGAIACMIIFEGKAIQVNVADIKSSKKVDLALIKVRGLGEGGLGLKPIKLAKKMPSQGSTVFACGHPKALPYFVSQGLFNYELTEDRLTFALFTAQISPGSSGGALVNGRGELIGITTAAFINAQNINLAVPVKEVVSFLKEK
jgi:S1-C subfamily serine protease